MKVVYAILLLLLIFSIICILGYGSDGVNIFF